MTKHSIIHNKPSLYYHWHEETELFIYCVIQKGILLPIKTLMQENIPQRKYGWTLGVTMRIQTAWLSSRYPSLAIPKWKNKRGSLTLLLARLLIK